MNYYGVADQRVLPSVLFRLYAYRDQMLRPGTEYMVLPNGHVYTRPPRGPARMPECPNLPGAGVYPHAGGSPRAHLPFGFRPVRCADEHLESVAFPGQGRLARAAPDAPLMPHATYAIPRAGFDEFGAGIFVEGIMDHVWRQEGAACARELSRLPEHGQGLELGEEATVSDLCSRVGGIAHPGAPSGARLDTVFVDDDLLGLRLDGAARAAARLAPNILELHGTRVLAHPGTPCGGVCAVSNSHGPAFVSGPTLLACTDDAFLVSRYCGAVGPPRGPGGFRGGFGLRVSRAG